MCNLYLQPRRDELVQPSSACHDRCHRRHATPRHAMPWLFAVQIIQVSFANFPLRNRTEVDCKAEGSGAGRPRLFAIIARRGHRQKRIHCSLCHHTKHHNGLDSRVLTCRCSVPNLGPRSSPFLRCHAWEGGRGLTVCGVSRRVISRTRTTVHNSLPDCRGFKTRATRSRGRLRERSNHCRCCALHWAGQKE